jgi:hypothetical protein
MAIELENTFTVPVPPGDRVGDRRGRPEASRHRGQHDQPAAPMVRQEESLSAFRFVVVPVLKRVLPVAAVAVIIRPLVGRKS